MVRYLRGVTIFLGVTVIAGFAVLLMKPNLLMSSDRPDLGAVGEGPATSLAPPPPSRPQPSIQSAYTNEDQNASLRQEVSRMGITNLSQATDPSQSSEHGALGLSFAPNRRRETAERLRLMNEEMAERTQPPEVPISGRTALILGGGAVGGSDGAPGAAPLSDHWEGINSGGITGTRTIEGPSEWRRLWQDISLSAVPSVDFGHKEVVGVFAGVRPASQGTIRIVGLMPTATTLIVQYADDAPTPSSGVSGSALASPYALKVIDRTDLPIRFQKILSAAP